MQCTLAAIVSCRPASRAFLNRTESYSQAPIEPSAHTRVPSVQRAPSSIAFVKSAPARFAPVRSASRKSAPNNIASRKLARSSLAPRRTARVNSAFRSIASVRSAPDRSADTKRAFGASTPIMIALVSRARVKDAPCSTPPVMLAPPKSLPARRHRRQLTPGAGVSLHPARAGTTMRSISPARTGRSTFLRYMIMFAYVRSSAEPNAPALDREPTPVRKLCRPRLRWPERGASSAI